MTTKNPAVDREDTIQKESSRLAYVMTMIAWVVLSTGMIICLMNIGNFSDTDMGLMVGIGFLVASVQIYTIGTAINLFHNKLAKEKQR